MTADEHKGAASPTVQFWVCCCGPERASTAVSTAGVTQAKCLCSAHLSLGELLSTVLSRSQGRAEVSSSQISTYPVLTSREMHEGKQLEQLEGRTRQTRDFLFTFADRSRDEGKYATTIWQIPQVQCSSLWDVASQKSSPPNAAQKGWHNHIINLKHCPRLW